MEYLQYGKLCNWFPRREIKGFKPYYKWNTFNTNGQVYDSLKKYWCFKPYYKWNTFNTLY